MAKFLVHANYSGDGAKGLIKEGGSSRRDTIEKLVASAGGKMESFYFAFGKYDAIVIVDVPDNISAAAVALVATASGAVEVVTTVLITPEEIDEAAKKAPSYRAPGS